MNEEYQAYLRDKKFKESAEKQQEEASADLTQAALDSGLLNSESLAHLQNTAGKQLDLFGGAMTREQPADKMTQWRNNLAAGLEVEGVVLKSSGVFTTENENHYDTAYGDFNSVKTHILESARMMVEGLASKLDISSMNLEDFREKIIDSMAQILPDFMGDFHVEPIQQAPDGVVSIDVVAKFRNSPDMSRFRATVVPIGTVLNQFGLSATDTSGINSSCVVDDHRGLPGITGPKGIQGIPGATLEIYDGEHVHFQKCEPGFDLWHYSNYLAENIDKSISYSEYLAENLDESIEKINKSKDYTDYLATNLDKALCTITALEERLKLVEDRLSVFTSSLSLKATFTNQ